MTENQTESETDEDTDNEDAEKHAEATDRMEGYTIETPTETLNVEWVTRSDIQPNDWNPNYMTEAKTNVLKESILSNGWTQPIVVNKENDYIIDGEQRWYVAKDPDIAENSKLTPVGTENGKIPIYRISVSEFKSKLATVMHNSATGKHDVSKLRNLLQGLDEIGDINDVADKMGYNKTEISMLIDKDTAPTHNEPESLIHIPWPENENGEEDSGESLSFVITKTEHERWMRVSGDRNGAETVLQMAAYGIENDLVEPFTDDELKEQQREKTTKTESAKKKEQENTDERHQKENDETNRYP